MTKKLGFVVLIMVFCIAICGCKPIEKSKFNIKSDSITSIDFKKTIFPETTDGEYKFVQKSVTERDDIEALAKWIESLKITKHEAIEIPTEQVEYVLFLNGVKRHELIVFDNYFIYDATAYTFDNDSQKQSVVEKYNMLNYPQTDTELELIKQ